MDKELEKDFGWNLKFVGIGVGVSTIITIFSIFIFALILSYTNISEKMIESGLVVISSVSILIGSFFAIKKIREKGLVYGVILGVVYMLIIYIISSIITGNFSLGLGSIIMILLGILSGAIGGIIGVNIKN